MSKPICWSRRGGNHTGGTTTVSRGKDNVTVVVGQTDGKGGVDYSQHTLTGSEKNVGNVSDKSAKIIGQSMAEANVPSAKVSSTQRNPTEQASAMYDNAVNKGAASQYKLYGSSGDKVIKVFEMYSPEWCCTKTEAMGPMTDKIVELGPSTVSKHASDPNEKNVIDLAPSTFSNDKYFHNAFNNNPGVGVLLTPYNSTDPAFHIEIFQ